VRERVRELLCKGGRQDRGGSIWVSLDRRTTVRESKSETECVGVRKSKRELGSLKVNYKGC
jgi:hypothetical protein